MRRAVPWLLLPVAFTLILRSAELGTPPKSAPIKQFKLADDQNGRRKSLLSGKEARPLGNDRNLINVIEARFETYGENGQPAMILEAPECLFRIGDRFASSPGPLKAHTADGRMSIEGTGFELRQNDAHIVISNRVHAVIRQPDRSSLLAPKSVGSAPAGALKLRAQSSTNGFPEGNEVIEIYSDHFESDSRSKEVIFGGNVRASDPQMDLTCEILTLNLPPAGGPIERIVAEHDVVIIDKANGAHATSAKAVYTAVTDTMEMTGNPAWTLTRREGSGDRVLFDRKNNSFRVTGNVFMKFPHDALGSRGFLLPPPVAPPQVLPATPGFLEVSSDDFQSSSNLMLFFGKVIVIDPQSDPPGRLTCGRLTIRTSASDGKLETLKAEDRVRIEQGQKEVTGEEAVYASKEDLLVVRGKPAWKLEDRQGTAEVLSFDRGHSIFSGTGNARMQLPHRLFAGQNLFLGGLMSSTNSVRATNLTLDVFSQYYIVQTNVAVFHGPVRVDDPAGPDPASTLACGLMTVRFRPPQNRIESILAEQGVVFIGKPVTDGQPVAKGDGRKLQCETLKVDWDAAGSQIERVVADGKVVIEHGDNIATGAKAVFSAANNVVELTGNPTAKTLKLSIFDAEALIWDMTRSNLTARGKWRTRLQPGALGKSFQRPLESPR